jgi:hypothetical protein
MASTVAISVETKYLAPSDPSLPALALQVTRLVDSYMLWVGITEGSPTNVEKASLHGNLCKDWACAMPPKTVRSNVLINGQDKLRRGIRLEQSLLPHPCFDHQVQMSRYRWHNV